MANNTLSTPEKQTPRASDGAAKMIDGAHQIASAASNVLADKTHEAGAAVKQTSERVESAARGVVSGTKEVLNDVTHQASALLHDAQDVALDSYDAARDYALDAVHDASELAQRASERTVRYVRGASTATGKFATIHALPLLAVGASLAWLAWSVRSNSRRTELDLARRTPRSRATLEARRAPIQEQRELRASSVAPTTSGAKLLGVRGAADSRRGPG